MNNKTHTLLYYPAHLVQGEEGSAGPDTIAVQIWHIGEGNNESLQYQLSLLPPGDEGYEHEIAPVQVIRALAEDGHIQAEKPWLALASEVYPAAAEDAITLIVEKDQLATRLAADGLELVHWDQVREEDTLLARHILSEEGRVESAYQLDTREPDYPAVMVRIKLLDKGFSSKYDPEVIISFRRKGDAEGKVEQEMIAKPEYVLRERREER